MTSKRKKNSKPSSFRFPKLNKDSFRNLDKKNIHKLKSFLKKSKDFFDNLYAKILPVLKVIFKLPTLHEDSYEAIRLMKGYLYIFTVCNLLIITSIFTELSTILRLEELEVFVLMMLAFQGVFLLTILAYKKLGFNSKIFNYLNLATKITFFALLTTIIFFTKDPRTGWWFIYYFFIFMITQLSRFHWFFLALTILCPSVISSLYLYMQGDPSLKFSIFHRAFGYFVGGITGIFYYYQSRLRHSELLIKENNLELIKELNDLKIVEERDRISRELHDTLGASLTGNIIYTEITKELIHKDSKKAEETLEIIENLSRDALIKMREAVYSIMEDKELINNFCEYLFNKCQDLMKMKSIDFQYSCPGNISKSLSPKAKVNVYRIIGEWLTNILKHSEANQVVLKFSNSNAKIILSIQDNGLGFNVNEKTHSGGGLNNIDYRVQQVGGTLNISSNPSGGAKLEIVISPVKK